MRLDSKLQKDIFLYFFFLQSSNPIKFEGTSLKTLSSPTRDPNSSKQLQLQFVLDCKMIDPKTKQEITAERAPNADTTSTLKPAANHHKENFHTTLVPRTTKQLLKTTTPWYQNPIIIQSIMQTQAPPATTEKLKVKKVFVDPPGISEIGNAFEGFYDFFEDTFTEAKKEENKRKPVKKSTRDKITIRTSSSFPIIRRPVPTYQMPYYVPTRKIVQMVNRQPITYSKLKNPVNNRYKRTTLYPNRKIVPAQYVSVIDPQYADDPNNPNNFLTTKIHVTSQYGGAKPTAPMKGYKNNKNSDDSSEENEYYYDALTLNNLAADDDPDSSVSREEEEEDDDDDDDTSDIESDEENNAEENVEYPIPTDKTQKKQRKRKTKDKVSDNSEEYSYENVDYDFTSKIGSYGESMGNFFSSVGEYIPYLPSFGRQSAGDEDENRGVSTVKVEHKVDASRITTPHSEYRHPKQPSDTFYGYDYSKSVETNKVESDGDSSWFSNSFFFGSNEDTIATASEILTTTESPSYFDWFGSGSNEEKQSSEESSSNGNISSK